VEYYISIFLKEKTLIDNWKGMCVKIKRVVKPKINEEEHDGSRRN
jgi:hypothetical protein